MKKELLDLLVCPQSKAVLIYDRTKEELQCKESGLAYPVRDGIPVLLIEEARQMSEQEKTQLKPANGRPV